MHYLPVFLCMTFHYDIIGVLPMISLVIKFNEISYNFWKGRPQIALWIDRLCRLCLWIHLMSFFAPKMNSSHSHSALKSQMQLIFTYQSNMAFQGISNLSISFLLNSFQHSKFYSHRITSHKPSKYVNKCTCNGRMNLDIIISEKYLVFCSIYFEVPCNHEKSNILLTNLRDLWVV